MVRHKSDLGFLGFLSKPFSVYLRNPSRITFAPSGGGPLPGPQGVRMSGGPLPGPYKVSEGTCTVLRTYRMIGNSQQAIGSIYTGSMARAIYSIDI